MADNPYQAPSVAADHVATQREPRRPLPTASRWFLAYCYLQAVANLATPLFVGVSFFRSPFAWLVPGFVMSLVLLNIVLLHVRSHAAFMAALSFAVIAAARALLDLSVFIRFPNVDVPTLFSVLLPLLLRLAAPGMILWALYLRRHAPQTWIGHSANQQKLAERG